MQKLKAILPDVPKMTYAVCLPAENGQVSYFLLFRLNGHKSMCFGATEATRQQINGNLMQLNRTFPIWVLTSTEGADATIDISGRNGDSMINYTSKRSI